MIYHILSAPSHTTVLSATSSSRDAEAVAVAADGDADAPPSARAADPPASAWLTCSVRREQGSGTATNCSAARCDPPVGAGAPAIDTDRRGARASKTSC